MQSKKKVDTSFEGGNNRFNQNLATNIGLILFIVVVISIFFGNYLSNSRIPKFNSIENAKLNLSFYHLDLENKSSVSSNKKKSINTFKEAKNDFKRLLNNKSWSNYFYPTLTNPQKATLNQILNRLTLNDSVYIDTLNLKSNIAKYQSNFSLLINKISDFQVSLYQRHYKLIKNFQFIQFLLFLVFIVYLIVIYFILKNYRQKNSNYILSQEKVLQELKQKNYILKKSQFIANIGYYRYDFKTKLWTASEFILKLLNYNEGKYPLDMWINIIHPDDRTILTDVLKKRLYNPNTTLDVSYRIISPKDGNLHWIHHFTQAIEQNKKGENLPIVGIIQDITLQKENDVRLNRFNQIMESTLNEIYIVDYNMLTFIEVNDAVLFNLNYTKQEILDLKLTDVAPDISAEKIEELRLKLTTKKTIIFKTYNKRKDGSTYPVEVHIQKGKQGDIDAFFIIVLDISERDTSIKKLENADNRWKFAVEGTNDGLWDLNYKTNEIYYSKRWKEMLGYNDHELKNTIETWRKLVHPDDLERVEFTSHLHFDKKTQNYTSEYRMLCKDGTYKWVLDRGKVVERDKAEKPVRFIGVITDISERKALDKPLSKKSEVLSYHIKHSPLAAIFTDNNSIIKEWNKAAECLFGFSEEEALGKNLIDLIVPDNDKTAIKTVCNDLILEKGSSISNNTNLTKESNLLDCIWYNTLIKDEYNQPIGIASLVENITKQKALEETIQNITAQKLSLEKINQSEAILNNLNSLVLVVDKNSDIKYTSQSVRNILGYEPKEMLEQGWWQLTFDDLKTAKELNKKAYDFVYNNMASNQNILLRNIKTKSGDFKWIEWHYSKGLNDTYIAVGIDVTKRQIEAQTKKIIYNITKKAHETVNLEILFNFIKEELSSLINTNNFFIALYDKNTDLISTPYMVDQLDDDNDFPKGKTLTGYIIDNKKSILADYMDLIKLKQEQKIEILGPLSKCWLGVPLIIKKEAIGAIVIQSYTDEKAYTPKDVNLIELVASNISQVINKIRDYEKINLLNKALIQSPEAVYITNLNNEIEFVNPAFIKLNGYTEQEVFGKKSSLLKSADQFDEIYKTLKPTLNIGKTWTGEYVNKRKDGSRYLVNANISPVKNNQGEITHIITIEEDVTEKRELERNFIQALIEAQEKEKQSFGEDLHDGLGQILTAESMYIDLLLTLNNNSEDKTTEFLTKIKELNLNAIYDTRGIAHGLMSTRLKEEGLINAIDQICKDYNNSKDIAFSFEHQGLKEDDIEVEIKTQLYRITQEISTNIIRHSEATKATISLNKSNANQLELIIKDNGIGFDIENLEKEKKGAGILNIKRRVKLLNGTTTIESEKNKGTKYNVIVPLVNI